MKIFQKLGIGRILLSISAFVFIVAGVGLFAGSAHAMTPTLSVYSTNAGSNQVQITVYGDPYQSVNFYYTNPGSGSVQTVNNLGSTNSSGYFSTTLNTYSYNIQSGSNVYVIVNNQQSPMVAWPYGDNNNNCYNNGYYNCGNSTITLSQSNVSLNIGQSQNITVYNSYNNNFYNNFYISSNSNSSIVTASVSGNTISLYGNSYGSATLTVCASGNSSGCTSLYVTVGNGNNNNYNNGNGIYLSQSNANISTGESVTITSSSNNLYVSSNSNSSVANVTVNGGTLTVMGENSGSATISVCSSAYPIVYGYNNNYNYGNNCATLYVTVSGSYYGNNGSAPVFSQPNITMNVGQTTTVTISGSNATYYLGSNSNPTAVPTTVNGGVISIVGSQAGTATISVCASNYGYGNSYYSGSNCSNLYVTVNPSTPITYVVPPSKGVYLNQVPYTGAGSTSKVVLFVLTLAAWTGAAAYYLVKRRATKLAMSKAA